MRSRIRNQQGFTLVELMVVVAIIGILAAIGVPQLNKFVRQAETSEPAQRMADIAKNIQGYIDQRPAVGAEQFSTDIESKVLSTDTTESTLDDVVSTLSLPDTDKWIYTVVEFTLNDTTRIATLCIKAVRNDESTNLGEVFYHSSNQTATGWDGNYYRVPYINATASGAGSCSDVGAESGEDGGAG